MTVLVFTSHHAQVRSISKFKLSIDRVSDNKTDIPHIDYSARGRREHLAAGDVTPNYHPVLIRASALLLPMWAGEARGCLA